MALAHDYASICFQLVPVFNTQGLVGNLYSINGTSISTYITVTSITCVLVYSCKCSIAGPIYSYTCSTAIPIPVWDLYYSTRSTTVPTLV
eukprot:SAG11_NODE_1626_length_4552_cov_21.053223_4_plen_90_part_00